MSVFDKIFNNNQDKTTVSRLLSKDDIEDLQSKYREKYADNSLNAIITFITKDHEVFQIGDKGMPDDAKAIGILVIAILNIYKNGLCHD